jgi:hypothetical protein
MVADVIFPGWAPFKNLAVSQDIPDWIRAQDIAMGYQWQTLVVKAYLDAAAAKVAGPVVAKYLGRLAAADVFTADNAYVMFEALRVDYGPFGDHP